MACSDSYYFSPMLRRKSVPVDIGGVIMGGDAPIVIQSMTNTDTADVENSVKQIEALFEAGSEIVRLTVDRDESARAIPLIHEKLVKKGLNIPLVGDFHYIGHQLLADYPESAKILSKYRINPGNIGFKQKKDIQFSSIVEMAIRYDKPVRIGVNWGSLDQELLTVLMDKNKTQANPRSDQEVIHEAIIQSALLSAQFAESIGLPRNKIVLSAKVSQVQDLFSVSTRLAALSDYALHLGLTEAGMGVQGMVSSSAALGMLLQMGIGDTIRISLTPEPGGDRSLEVQVARQLLQSLGLRRFFPSITACPGCGRTTSSYFQELSRRVENYIKDKMPVWSKEYPGSESLKVAVMGCIVNGPGESKHADIGISLPGTGEHPVAPVYVEGVKVATLRGENLAIDFEEMIFDYVQKKYKKVA